MLYLIAVYWNFILSGDIEISKTIDLDEFVDSFIHQNLISYEEGIVPKIQVDSFVLRKFNLKKKIMWIKAYTLSTLIITLAIKYDVSLIGRHKIKPLVLYMSVIFLPYPKKMKLCL